MKVIRVYDPEFSTCVPLAEWLESPREAYEEMAEDIAIRRDNLLMISNDMIKLSRWLTWEVQTPEIEQESATGLRYASKMYAAFFECAEQPEKISTFKIYDLPEVSWNGKGLLEGGYITPSEWCEAYFLAVITRDKESMESLAKFPVDIMKQSASKAGPVSYLLIEVFKAYQYKEDNILMLVDSAMEAAMKQSNDWALDIAMGYLETFAALTTDIGFDFNEKLAKNLEIQEKHHINARHEDLVPVDSFIPLELLGMACMWHDKGNKVTVESDSLPRFLIEGTYL